MLVESRLLQDPLGHLPKLKNLQVDLEGNSVGAEGTKSLAAALQNLTQLTNLQVNLEGNSVGAEGTKSLATALQNLTQLTNLQGESELQQCRC